MKTILKQLFFAMILATMTVAVSAQSGDPCEGLNESYKEWSEVQFPKKDVAGLREAVEKGKVFLEKFGSCPEKEAFKDSKEFVDFVKAQVPIKKKRIETITFNERKKALTNRVLSNLDKNWDEVYAAGKELLGPEFKEEFYCDVRIIMATAGYDEFRKSKNNKYSSDTIKYAKDTIAYLNSGGTCKAYGYQKWGYANKEEALGWLSYNIGYLYTFDKADLKEGANYMFKVSQMNVAAAKDAAVYASLTRYYIPQLNDEVKKLQALPVPAEGEPEEAGKLKADAIKAQTAVVRGLADRIMETTAQTFVRIDNSAANKTLKEGVMEQFKTAYGTRFNTKDTAPATGMVTTYSAKPVANPSNPVAPIAEDPTPSATTAPTTTAPITAVKPVTPATKPAGPVGPAAKPTTNPGAKPTAPGARPGVAKAKKTVKR